MTEPETIVHAYGVLAADQTVPHLTGVGGAAVEVVEASGMAVMVSHVPADEFGPTTWDEHADDIQWLGSVARGHEHALEGAVAVGDVVPFRLPSMYTSVDALSGRIAHDREFLASSLGVIAGRVEWGVKVYRVAPDTRRARTAAVTGASYLQSRAGELRGREDADARLRQLLSEITERLEDLSDDAVYNRVQDAALSGRSEQMVLNGAYLVRRERQQSFVEAAQSLAHGHAGHGLIVEPVGPWPAYNFVLRPSPQADGP